MFIFHKIKKFFVVRRLHYELDNHNHNTIGAHEPVLKIADGDSVVTSTIDARGWDYRVESVAGRGNPMTGPFYVEGAQPGDTLALRLESMVPSRDWGWTFNVLAPNVVDPFAPTNFPPLDIVRWSVDAEQGLVVWISRRPV